jgi:hypothetical protein
MYDIKKLSVATVYLLLLVAGLFWVYRRTWKPSPPRVDLRVWESLGHAAAREAARMLGGQGKIMVLEVIEPTHPYAPSIKKGFDLATQKHGGLSILHRQSVAFSQLGEEGTSPQRILDLMRAHPDADLIVSFAGPPYFQEQSEAQSFLAALPSSKPKLMVAWNYAKGSYQ